MAGLRRLTPGVADAIVNAVRKGIPAGTALRAAGIHDANMVDWLEAPVTGYWRSGVEVADDTRAFLADFRERVLTAQAEHEQDMISAIEQAGHITGKSGVPEWRALAWMANNHPSYRARYRQERGVQVVSGDIQHIHEHRLVREMPDDVVRTHVEALDT